ncbi:MAG TPA: hypothetical protein VJ574_01170, partial [Candidatus Bathyarchaeia archaeon]|nr:hypothetical protein [Candidatus Bathyarchaeia archaeon]
RKWYDLIAAVIVWIPIPPLNIILSIDVQSDNFSITRISVSTFGPKILLAPSISGQKCWPSIVDIL